MAIAQPHPRVVTIRPAYGLAGRPVLPADKSISHRAALLAALAEGESEIVGLSDAADPQSTLGCLRALGVRIEEAEGAAIVHGAGRTGLRPAAHPLDCGNSGTTMRLLAGILAGQPFESALVGDASLSRRPMERIASPLRQMGADIRLNQGLPPVHVRGGALTGMTYELPVPSAQVKSAVLLAGLFASGETTVVEPVASRDHTERMLGIPALELGGKRHLTVSAEHPIPAGLWVVPRDLSAAAFFLVAAAIITPSAIEMRAVGINPTRAAVLDVLQAMGASISLREHREYRGEPIADILVQNDGAPLAGITIDGPLIPNLIDELPVLAVAAAYAEGTTIIRDAEELRVKETDRIAATAAFLTAMGADVEQLPDGMTIRGGRPLHGAAIDSHGDHRIAMAAAVAALGATGETRIHGAEAVGVSYPGFWTELARLSGDT